MVSEDIKESMENQHYALVGKNSAVQICSWTKKSLVDKGVCYKEKFYGISCHRCCQMSPSIVCPNRCIHCWRPMELGLTATKLNEFDSPEELLEECIKAQRKLLSGFGGNDKLNKKKFEEAQDPNQFAISLIGEPTLYPKLGEFINLLRSKGKHSFLVTNGLYPERIKELKKKNNLPTQIYLSLNSPNKEMYEKWHRSKIKNAWKKFNQTLDLFSKLKTRRVIRLTLAKDINLVKPKEYAELIKKSNTDFIEVKSFIAIGYARDRLGKERMISHQKVREFSEELLKYLPEYKFLGEQERSLVVLLGKDKKKMKIKKSEI